MASFSNETAIIQFLLEEGINPNVLTPDGHSILLRMAMNGNNELIELYFSKGGNIHVMNQKTKDNVLHYSAYYAQLETTKYLVSLGVDYKAKNVEWKIPLDYAKEVNRTENVEFLQDVEKK